MRDRTWRLARVTMASERGGFFEDVGGDDVSEAFGRLGWEFKPAIGARGPIYGWWRVLAPVAYPNEVEAPGFSDSYQEIRLWCQKGWLRVVIAEEES